MPSWEATNPHENLKFRTHTQMDLAQDAWIGIMAFGDDQMPSGLVNYDPRVTPRVVTNPIYLDSDQDGQWTAPGGKTCIILKVDVPKYKANSMTILNLNTNQQWKVHLHFSGENWITSATKVSEALSLYSYSQGTAFTLDPDGLPLDHQQFESLLENKTQTPLNTKLTGHYCYVRVLSTTSTEDLKSSHEIKQNRLNPAEYLKHHITHHS